MPHCPKVLSVTLLLTTFITSVGASPHLFHETGCGLYPRACPRASSKDLERATFVDSMATILSTIDELSPVYIQLLYDHKYTEEAGELSSRLVLEDSGVSVFRLENSLKNSILRIVDSSLSSERTILVLILCDTPRIVEVFDEIYTNKLQSHAIRWVLYMKEEDTNFEALWMIEDRVFEGTEVTLILQEASGVFRILELQVEDDGDLGFIIKGNWHRNSTLTARRRLKQMLSRESNKYSNMRGRELKISALQNPPFVGLGEENQDGSFEPKFGIDLSIIDILSENLNFTYRLVQPLDGSWGNVLPNGTCTGMLGMLVRRETQVAVSCFAINRSRKSVIDFTTPYFQGYLSIISRAPKQKNRALAVLSPFTLQVWLSIALATLSMGPILMLFARISSSVLGSYDDTKGLQFYSFSAFRSLVIQSNTQRTHYAPQRIVFISWYFFCLIVSALYSGTLTAVLAVPTYETPINSLEDLPGAAQNGFTLGIEGDSSNEYLFKNAKSGIYKEIWGLFSHDDRSKSFVDIAATGLNNVLKKKFAFIGVDIKSRIIAAGLGTRNFHFSRDTFYPQNMGIGITRGAPYKENFDRVVFGLFEGGIISKFQEDEARKMSKHSTSERSSESSKSYAITLTHLQVGCILHGGHRLLVSYVWIHPRNNPSCGDWEITTMKLNKTSK